MSDGYKKCFFCSKDILPGEMSKEHIIMNCLLKKNKLMNSNLFNSNSNISKNYGRLKISAHKKCNNELGNNFDREILKLLDDEDKLYDSLIKKDKEISLEIIPNKDSYYLISVWLLKIYYGLFYYDSLYSNGNSKKFASEIVNDFNFELIRKSYLNNNGFFLPSSLYVFKSKNLGFDLITTVYPQVIMLKVNHLIFILCVGDGELVKNYLYGDNLLSLRKDACKYDQDNWPIQRYLFAEILSLRLCIPKNPKFICSDNKIVNLSFNTLVENPTDFYKIDLDKFKSMRAKCLLDFGFKQK